jgi:hypothetical protein
MLELNCPAYRSWPTFENWVEIIPVEMMPHLRVCGAIFAVSFCVARESWTQD